MSIYIKYGTNNIQREWHWKSNEIVVKYHIYLSNVANSGIALGVLGRYHKVRTHE